MYGHHPVTQEPFLNLTTAQPRGLSHLDLGGKGKEVQGGEGSRSRSLSQVSDHSSKDFLFPPRAQFSNEPSNVEPHGQL